MAEKQERKTTKAAESKASAHILSEVVTAARDGKKFKFDKEGKYKFDEAKSPYFNRVTGTPGTDTLQLRSAAFEDAAKKGQSIVFVLSHRLVGTREELRAFVEKVNAYHHLVGEGAFRSDTLLSEGNIVSSENLNSPRSQAALGVEAEKQALSRKGTKGPDLATLAELDRVYQRALDAKAARGTGVGKKSPRGKGTGGKSAADRLREKFASTDVLLNVSSRTNSGARSIKGFAKNKAPGPGSQYRNVAGRFSRIYSTGVDEYVEALKDLGATAQEVDLHRAEFIRNQGTQANRTANPTVPSTVAQGTILGPQVPSTYTVGASPSRVNTVVPRAASPSRLQSAQGAPVIQSSGNSGTNVITPMRSPRGVGQVSTSPTIPPFNPDLGSGFRF